MNSPPVHLVLNNASFIQCLKNQEHYDLIFNILSYNRKWRLGKRLISDRGSEFDKRSGKFGIGLFPYIIKELENKNIPYKTIINVNPVKLHIKEKIIFKNIIPEKYQSKAISVLNKGIKRGRFEAVTGAGKTIFEAMIIKKFSFPTTLVIVPSRNIGKQTVKSLENSLGREIGFVGEGQKNWKRITVALWQSLQKLTKQQYKELNNYLQLIIVDEAHLAIEKINFILSNFDKVWYRYALTGTDIPKYEKKDYFQLTAQLGEKISTTTQEDAKSRVITDIKLYMFEFSCEPKYKNYMDIYRKDVLLNHDRCKLLSKMVDFALNIKKRKNVLLLVDEYKQALIIAKYSKIKPIIAWSKTDNEKIKADFIAGKIKYCIATPVFSVGTDIPNIDCVISGSARKSLRNIRQKIGRGLRKTEKNQDLLVLDIYDSVNNDFIKYSKIRKNFYKSKKWLKQIFTQKQWEKM
jgi:superfamily II DNA or RNA helicase